MSISVIIPVFNEESMIQNTIRLLDCFLYKHFENYEIIAVDDGSTDNTLQELACTDAVIIKHGQNYGKGAAVRTGILNARGDYIFFMDADLSYPLEFLLEGTAALASADIVMANRDGDYPTYRKFFSNTYGFIVQGILGIHYKDIQCGIKGFRRKAAQNLFSRGRIDGFAFDTEILFLAEKTGYAVCAVTVPVTHRKESKVSLMSDSFKMALDLMRIRRFYKKGDYHVEEMALR